MKAQIRFGVWGRKSTATSSASEGIELDRDELIARIGQVTRLPAPELQATTAPVAPPPQALWRRNLPQR